MKIINTDQYNSLCDRLIDFEKLIAISTNADKVFDKLEENWKKTCARSEHWEL